MNAFKIHFAFSFVCLPLLFSASAAGQTKVVMQTQRLGNGELISFPVQVSSNPHGANLPAPYFMNSSSGFNQLIQNHQVRKDLELDRDQIKELAFIQKEFQEQLQAGMKEAQDGSKFDSVKWSKTASRIIKENQSAMNAVLLPHQSKRLKQISTQMEMKNRGEANTLIAPPLAKELGIDAAQARKIQKRSAEIKVKLARKMAELKEEARKELLRELSSSQRKKLEELTGEKFELNKPPTRSYPTPKRQM